MTAKYRVLKTFNGQKFVVNTQDATHTGEWVSENELAMLNGELSTPLPSTPEEMAELHKLLEEAADIL